MPILWRYLLSQYLKVFFLSMFAFTLLLIISRLHETANFASLGAPITTLLFFVLYQFPYILPIAIPISCLIASLLLMQRLSTDYELVAFFSLGIGIKKLLTPLLGFGVILSCANFYIASEVATDAHLASKRMVQEISSLNPLTLLKNAQFLKRKDAIISSDNSRGGSSCKDVMIALRRQGDSRTTLYFAKELNLKGQDLIGKNVTVLSSVPAKEEGYDHLLIENQGETRTPATEFTHLLRKNPWRVCPDHLKMPLLLSKIKQEHMQESSKFKRFTLNKCYSEIARRIQLGLTPFAFTLMGCTFGIEISRRKAKKGIIVVSVLAILTFAFFFLGKSVDTNATLSTILYFFPITLIIAFSILALFNVSKGIEK